MNTGQDPEAVILINEVHTYMIELADISTVDWREGSGSIRVQVPYDGTVFKEDGSRQERFRVGNLLITRPNGDEIDIETLPIDIQAGKMWRTHLRSGRRAVCEALYAIARPKAALISVQGEVLDFSPTDGVAFGDMAAFQNPLRLRIELWLPDLVEDDPEEKVVALERMILQREHTQQIFLPHADNASEPLAENLAALSNSYGGVLFVGVDKSGKIGGLSESEAERVPQQLLQAVLRATPPIRLREAGLYRLTNGRSVYVVHVPQKSRGVIHAVDGHIYVRQRKETVRTSEAAAGMPKPTVPARKSLDDLVRFDEKGKPQSRGDVPVVVVSGADGVESVPIGLYVCAMCNSEFPEANVVIYELVKTTQKAVEAHLKAELAHAGLEAPAFVELIPRDERAVALITVSTGHVPAALYEGKGYIWKDSKFVLRDHQSLLDQYVIRGRGGFGQPGMGDMRLARAAVRWPIRPAEQWDGTAWLGDEAPDYDVQHHQLVWRPAPFTKHGEEYGYRTSLTLPLTNVSLIADDQDNPATLSTLIRAQIEVELDGVLSSGLEVSAKAEPDEGAEEEEQAFLSSLPIIKRTCLQLNVTMRLNELLRHRRPQRSLMRFFLTNVMLDVDRARDVVLACADAGFRLYQLQPDFALPEVNCTRRSWLATDGRWILEEAFVSGSRNNRYHDISLHIGMRCIPTGLTRELHYEDILDKVGVNAFTLEVVMALEGKGEEVRQEISRLQVLLFELLHQRLEQPVAA